MFGREVAFGMTKGMQRPIKAMISAFLIVVPAQSSRLSCLTAHFCFSERRNVENTPWWNTHQAAALSVMEIREVFAHNLRTLRQAKGLSQEELAHLAGIDRTYVSSLERCLYNASIDVVDRLANVLGVDAAELLRRPIG